MQRPLFSPVELRFRRFGFPLLLPRMGYRLVTCTGQPVRKLSRREAAGSGAELRILRFAAMERGGRNGAQQE